MRTRVGWLLTPGSLSRSRPRRRCCASYPRPCPLPCWRPGPPGAPPYPNRQRERIQNPRSVRSSRTGGTLTWRSSGSHRHHLPSPTCLAPPHRPYANPSGAHSPRQGPTDTEYGGPVTEPAPHMTPEQFREHGHEVVDWIADYWSRIGSFPVRSQVAPGDVRAALPPIPPEQGEPFSAVLADLDRVVLPGITHWQHPGFFGYFPANTSGPSVLGDLVSAGLGVQGMSWM